LRSADDTGAGRSGGGIAAPAQVCLLIRDQVSKQGVEFVERFGQVSFDLAAVRVIDCVAKLGAQFFDVLFDGHLRLPDVCERWTRRRGWTMTGQGSRQRSAEPACGGADFVGARRRQNWRGRTTLRRHCCSATLADQSRQVWFIVWHPAEPARRTRDRLEAPP